MNGKGYLHLNLYRGGLNSKGEREGFGVQLFPNGCAFAGFWEGNQANGGGRLTLPDATVIEGNYKNSIISNGTIRYFDGSKFEGSFEGDSNERFAQGKFEFQNGSKLFGKWSNGVIEAGRLVDADGNLLSEFSGNTLVHTNGRSGVIIPKSEKWLYQGEIFSGKPHGKGIIFSTFFQYYHGHFEEEKIKGSTYRMRIQWGEISEGVSSRSRKEGQWRRLLTKGYEIVGDVSESKATVRFPYMNNDSFVGSVDINWKSDEKPYKFAFQSGTYYFISEDSVIKELQIKEPMQSIFQLPEVKSRGLNFDSVFSRIISKHPHVYKEAFQFILKSIQSKQLTYNGLHRSLQKRFKLHYSDVESSMLEKCIQELNFSANINQPSLKGFDDLGSNFIIETGGTFSHNQFSKLQDDTVLNPLIKLVDHNFPSRAPELISREKGFKSLPMKSPAVTHTPHFGSKQNSNGLEQNDLQSFKKPDSSLLPIKNQKGPTIYEPTAFQMDRSSRNLKSPNSNQKNGSTATNPAKFPSQGSQTENGGMPGSEKPAPKTVIPKSETTLNKASTANFDSSRKRVLTPEADAFENHVEKQSLKELDGSLVDTSFKIEKNRRQASALPIKPGADKLNGSISKEKAMPPSPLNRKRTEMSSNKKDPLKSENALEPNLQLPSRQDSRRNHNLGSRRSHSQVVKPAGATSSKAIQNPVDAFDFASEADQVHYFRGRIVKGAMSGSCKVITGEGTYKEGRFVSNKMEGYGVVRHSNGITYQGNFRESVLDGQGSLQVNGLEVRGEFEEGEIKSKRVHALKNGVIIIADKEMSDPGNFSGDVNIIFKNSFSLQCKLLSNQIILNQTCNLRDRFGNAWVGEVKRDSPQGGLLFCTISHPRNVFRVRFHDEGVISKM